jgi:hypothetical protein
MMPVFTSMMYDVGVLKYDAGVHKYDVSLKGSNMFREGIWEENNTIIQ